MNVVLLSLFVIHYIQRALIYPLFRMKSGAAPMPISVMFMAFLFCLWNGLTQSVALSNVELYPKDTDRTREWVRIAVGSVIWAIGFYLNITCDSILMGLKDKPKPDGYVELAATGKEATEGGGSGGARQRKGDSSSTATPGADSSKADSRKTRYKIPYGSLFTYVSCANYTGELIEWLGFAIACWNLPALGFFVYSFSNLAPRAHKHHQWYLEVFGDEYKKLGRWAVVPGLW